MSNRKQAVTPELAAKTGPYSPGILVGDTLYVSGQGPLDARNNNAITGDTIEAQTQLTLANVRTILEEAGFGMQDVVKANVYLADLADYGRFNTVYRKHFADPLPARTLVEAKLLGIMVEIDVIAVRGAGGQATADRAEH